MKEYEDLINWLGHAPPNDFVLLSKKQKKIYASKSARQILRAA
ncbi:MAG: hypothetical protein AABW59_04045 [archaeon]